MINKTIKGLSLRTDFRTDGLAVWGACSSKSWESSSGSTGGKGTLLGKDYRLTQSRDDLPAYLCRHRDSWLRGAYWGVKSPTDIQRLRKGNGRDLSCFPCAFSVFGCQYSCRCFRRGVRRQALRWRRLPEILQKAIKCGGSEWTLSSSLRDTSWT